MTDTIDTAAAEAFLIEERIKVLRQLEEIGADESGQLNGTVDYGDAFADAGAVTAERTEVLRLAEALKIRLDRANVALSKIADGRYGICETCGEQIGLDRLQYLPAVRRCVRCKQAAS
ncbi:MAG: TraR/DksA family transcriptional regulator [Actinomycetota bacterium]|nr:TraR/DksA family transcriptional regulator [Actinomycetota bacterium]